MVCHEHSRMRVEVFFSFHLYFDIKCSTSQKVKYASDDFIDVSRSTDERHAGCNNDATGSHCNECSNVYSYAGIISSNWRRGCNWSYKDNRQWYVGQWFENGDEERHCGRRMIWSDKDSYRQFIMRGPGSICKRGHSHRRPADEENSWKDQFKDRSSNLTCQKPCQPPFVVHTNHIFRMPFCCWTFIRKRSRV